MGSKRLVVAAVVVVMTAVLLRTQVVDTMTVVSGSMAPTLCTGDTVLVTKVGGGSDVRVGDVVTFAGPEDGARTIKRVVGVAGQRVALEDGELVVDGRPVHEPYVDQATIDGVYFGPVTVPAGQVFLMGDNREVSIDSRRYGPIPTADITGRLLTDLSPSCHP